MLEVSKCMLHATLQIGMKYIYIYEIANVEGIKRNKKIFKQIYKVTLFAMSKVLKVLYTYISILLTVASLLSNSNWVNM